MESLRSGNSPCSCSRWTSTPSVLSDNSRLSCRRCLPSPLGLSGNSRVSSCRWISSPLRLSGNTHCCRSSVSLRSGNRHLSGCCSTSTPFALLDNSRLSCCLAIASPFALSDNSPLSCCQATSSPFGLSDSRSGYRSRGSAHSDSTVSGCRSSTSGCRMTSSRWSRRSFASAGRRTPYPRRRPLCCMRSTAAPGAGSSSSRALAAEAWDYRSSKPW